MKSVSCIPGKIIDLTELQHQVKRWRLQNKKIVFTNGVFDILHEGHIVSLSEAASFGHILIVGVNADESVKRLKGPGRPLMNEYSRALLLASLVITDAVILFREDTPLNLISSILPDVLVKGGDYTKETTAGAAEVIAAGGRFVSIAFASAHSTTALVKRIRRPP